MKILERAIFKTLVYADIFDYPLTASQIGQFLIAKKKASRLVIDQALNFMVKKKRLGSLGRFYFLPGKQMIVAKRLKREKLSLQKIKIALRVARWLKLIPTVKMVAVTGALAMNNSAQNDDIDLLIVTTKNRLWLTRLLTVLLTELIASRRRPGNCRVKNKICLNMFLDEAHLKVPEKEQDLFIAHEVCQLKPLWDRGNVYQKFISQNQWFQKYLANWKF